MICIRIAPLTGFMCLLLTAAILFAEEPSTFTHQEDVIYGRKFGTALTMDVFTPKKDANGAAVIFVVSAGWRSGHRFVFNQGQTGRVYPQVQELLDRGYTVFSVVHGSQPKYTIPEIIQDLHKAVRFIRYNARRFHIDPGRIGIWGGSSGGHLSLMQGTAGDKGNPVAKDPEEQTSSRVQVVIAYFPVTDFLNYGKTGIETSGGPYAVAFDFHEFDNEVRSFLKITDKERIRNIKRRISPITHVTSDDPPTLIFHGDSDKLVPLQQSELIMSKFKEAGVTSKLVLKPGAGHGWKPTDDELKEFANWFDKHLQNSAKE